MARAEILTIGSELLTPGKRDTNSTYLIEQLLSLGIPVVFRATVGDDRVAISRAVEEALARADLLLVTGGLGPTSDDVTREGVSDALGLSMSEHRPTMARIRERFATRGIEMPEVNRKQALVPAGAELLDNRVGTAPGLWIEPSPGKTLVLLPGPPAELTVLFETMVRPRLSKSAGGRVYRALKLWLVGLPESSVDERVGSICEASRNPRTTILASAGQIELRLTASAPTIEEAEASNQELAGKIRNELSDYIFSECEESLERVVCDRLVEAGLRISVAESLTGGLIMHRLTQVPGSSKLFDEGFVTYSNESKAKRLGVPTAILESVGAVSEQVALSMSKGIRRETGSDIGLAVTGIAGPDGGSEEKPVGLVYIAMSVAGSEWCRRVQLPGGRQQVKLWTSALALDMVRRRLLGLPILP